MFGINKAFNSRLDKWSLNRLNTRSAFTANNYANPLSGITYSDIKPAWIELKAPEHFESAVRHNPIVKAAVNLLATSASNGKKQLVDASTGEDVDWSDKSLEVQKLKKLLVDRPNPLQSAKEFAYQGVFYLKTFGNRYVYALMPTGFDAKLDLMNIEALYNLPSQFIKVHTTGKVYNQTDISGIISKYARTNSNPIEYYTPESILHFNEVNISSEFATVMGISKLEALRKPISNINACFEAMNSILVSRGMQGIISVSNKDGQGSIIPINPDLKEEVDDKFKNDYGLLNGQNPFLLTPVPLDYIKTAMNSEELGIYKEFSNNSILVGNEFNIPPELIKTYIQGATYENQGQSVRRLYQDATIPMVEDDDQYWNYRLDLQNYGLLLKTTWEHIPALQDAFKEKATAINLKGRTAKDAYDKEIITWNQYLELIELPTVEGGDVYKSERNLTEGATNETN